MLRYWTTLLAAAQVWTAHADPGRAQADLLMESSTYQPGKPVSAVIRITYEKGWHGYWINPGEGGMKTGVVWKLPDGWKAGQPGYPAPKRQLTGGLISYGYTGEVLLAVTLEPPASATGVAAVEAKLSWLACNDGACVPGEAVVRSTIEAGPPKDGPDAAIVRKAREFLPASCSGASLVVAGSGNLVHLTLAGEALPDLEGAEVFPVTEQALSPKNPILLARDGKTYRATAEMNEYATGDLRNLRIVIHRKDLPRPILAEWSGKNQP